MTPVVVFDTNILISAQLSLGGAPFRCVALTREGLAQSVTCREIMDELAAKLRGKFYYPPERAQRVIDELIKFSRVVAIPGLLTGIVSDAADHKVLECAVVGGATHIVSGDRRHLLLLGQHDGIPILSAAEFLRVVSKQST